MKVNTDMFVLVCYINKYLKHTKLCIKLNIKLKNPIGYRQALRLCARMSVLWSQTYIIYCIVCDLCSR